MTAFGDRPYTIVAAVDESDIAHEVMDAAVDLALRHGQPELHCIGVVEPGPGDTGVEAKVEALHGMIAALLADKVQALEAAAASEWRIQVHTRAGEPAEEIMTLALECEADLIIVGRYGERRRRLSIGAIPERVLRGSVCPVLVVQKPDYGIRAAAGCGDCAAVRKRSRGTAWFCDDHGRATDARSTSLPPG